MEEGAGMKETEISFVIPAYNEGGAIKTTIKSVLDLCSGQEWGRGAEVIVVDDGSTDKTADEAAEAGARVVRHPQNMGYGRALKSGIAAATHDTIVICDADNTYPLDAIPDLLNLYNKGYDMVVGARTGKHYEESFLKKRLRSVLRFLVEYASGRVIEDINSGLRVFSKKSAMPYFPRLCDTFSFTTSLTLAYTMTAKSVGYLPIDYHQRHGKSKVRLLRDALRTLQFITEAIMYYNPLKLFILFSVVLVCLSLAGFLSSLLFHLFTGYILGIGSLLLSILMFGLGLLSVLLKQIMHSFDQTRTTKNY